MRPNRLRSILSEGKPVFGTMINGMTSTIVPILLANAGFDFVFIDMEHGPFSIETAAELIRTIRLTGMTPLVRVPDGQYHLISRVMDAGAEGFMVPRVETREQVEFIVSCAKYPPMGKRGASTSQGHNDYQRAELHEFTRHMNQENLVILQIERKVAVDDIDELLSVPGVDVALIGPNDLALSLGVPENINGADLKDAIQKVLDASLKRGITVGMHIRNTDALLEWYRKGMRLLTWSTDVDMLRSSSEAGLALLKKGTGS